MNYLLIFLLIGFIPFIYSDRVYIPVKSENHQCDVCEERQLYFELHLNWPISYYLSKYRNLLGIIQHNNPETESKFIIKTNTNDRKILERLRDLCKYGWHKKFNINKFMIIPDKCPFHLKRCLPPYDGRDIVARIEYLNPNIVNSLSKFWAIIDNKKSQKFMDLWTDEYNKHGSCKINPTQYFQYAYLAAKNVVIELGKQAVNFSKISENIEITPFEFQAQIQRLIDNKRVGIRCIQGLEEDLKIFNNQIKTIILCYKLEEDNLYYTNCRPHIYDETNCENNTSSIFSRFDDKLHQGNLYMVNKDIKIVVANAPEEYDQYFRRR